MVAVAHEWLRDVAELDESERSWATSCRVVKWEVVWKESACTRSKTSSSRFESMLASQRHVSSLMLHPHRRRRLGGRSSCDGMRTPRLPEYHQADVEHRGGARRGAVGCRLDGAEGTPTLEPHEAASIR